jgi:hypothetical protein
LATRIQAPPSNGGRFRLWVRVTPGEQYRAIALTSCGSARVVLDEPVGADAGNLPAPEAQRALNSHRGN